MGRKGPVYRKNEVILLNQPKILDALHCTVEVTVQHGLKAWKVLTDLSAYLYEQYSHSAVGLMYAGSEP